MIFTYDNHGFSFVMYTNLWKGQILARYVRVYAKTVDVSPLQNGEYLVLSMCQTQKVAF